MPDFADAVLLAASLRPGERTAADLADEHGWALADIQEAVEALRGRKHLQPGACLRGWSEPAGSRMPG